jgi:hypothetical protein
MPALILIVFSLPAFSQDSRSGPVETTQIKVNLAFPEVPRMPARELVQLLKKEADIVIVDTQSADGYEEKTTSVIAHRPRNSISRLC